MDYNDAKKSDWLSNLKWAVTPYGNNFEIQEKPDPEQPRQSIGFAMIRVGHLLNENGARDRAKLIATTPEMLKFVADFLSTMENMTVKDFESGKDKELRNRARQILDQVNE